MSLGKQFRMKRVVNEDGTCLICALDHGMTSPTFLPPLADTAARLREAIRGGANVIMMSQGFARQTVAEYQKDVAWAMMLTASATGSTVPNQIVHIGSVEEAAALGADAVVVFVALTGPEEARMLEYVAQVGEACRRWGIPFIAEAEYPTTYKAVEELQGEYGFDYLIRNARLCAELGADIIKSNWPGDARGFEKIVQATRLPTVLAGGPRITDAELLGRMEAAMKAGAVGCSVGRNIFAHQHPEAMTRALSRVIRERWPATQALEELEEAVTARRGNPRR